MAFNIQINDYYIQTENKKIITEILVNDVVVDNYKQFI